MKDVDKIADIIMKRHHADLRYASAQGIAREILKEVAFETLRDKFAGQALAGMRFKNGASILEYATDAYNIADAMLAERAK